MENTVKDKNLIDQFKNLLPIFVLVGSLAGFYYNTQHRLDSNEKTIEALEKKLIEVNTELELMEKELKRVKKQKAK